MDAPTNFHFKLPAKGRPNDVAIPEVWYPGIRDYVEHCTSMRSVDPILGIKAVIIHATAGGSSTGAISVMKRADKPASFHWLVPDEDEPQHEKIVWACAPEARAAWHVRNAAYHPEVNGGATRCNHWSLGIEVVNSQLEDPFSDWQVKVTAQIVRYCWAKYPHLVDVVSHAKLDPQRRTDPGANFPWARFKKLVLTSQSGKPPAVAMKAKNAKKVKAAKSACAGDCG